MDREEFNCPLCLKLLFAPICTPCGHAFCKRCLSRALLLAAACPLCRAPCHLKADAVCPPLVLLHALRASYGAEYASRGEEVAAEAEEAKHERLGLFFLHFRRGPPQPGQPFELLVFEPRYLLLMQRCVENGLMFGLQDGAEARCGVTARVRETRPLPRGRLLVTGAVGARYRTLAPHATPADGDYGLHYAPIYFVEDEAPEALVGVGGAEAVAAAVRDAAAALGGAGGARLPAALERPLAGLELGAAVGALRGAGVGAAARLLAALPDADAARVHAACGPPPAPATPDEAASHWLVSALALTPHQRRAANDSVSTLVRLGICYGVLLVAEEQGAARRGSSPGGGGGGGGGGGAPPTDDTLRTFEGIRAEDALALYSVAGGRGGDDPDEDLKDMLPPQGGLAAYVRWALAKTMRVAARFLGHPLVANAGFLLALFAALYFSRQQ
jgi:hypothetical protein